MKLSVIPLPPFMDVESGESLAQAPQLSETITISLSVSQLGFIPANKSTSFPLPISPVFPHTTSYQQPSSSHSPGVFLSRNLFDLEMAEATASTSNMRTQDLSSSHNNEKSMVIQGNHPSDSRTPKLTTRSVTREDHWAENRLDIWTGIGT